MEKTHSNTIKELLTMAQIVTLYGFEINRGNFTSCPFHAEKTASMRIYERSFYCFGCHTGGDTIKFVQLLYGLDFKQAIEKINADFRLGLDLSAPPNFKTVSKIMMQRKEEEIFKSWVDKAFKTLIFYFKFLRDERHPDSKYFHEALVNIENTEYLIEYLRENPVDFYKYQKKEVERVARRLRDIGFVYR